jgi:hypothetical protein
MTLTDQQVLNIVNALLDYEGGSPVERVQCLRARRGGAASQPALRPLIDRYLAITNFRGGVAPPQTCQVEHDHWEGKMICGNTLPCPRHGGQ